MAPKVPTFLLSYWVPWDSQQSSNNMTSYFLQISKIFERFPVWPRTWTMITTAGFCSLHNFSKCSTSKPRLSLSASQRTGSRPNWIKGETVVTQLIAGTMAFLFFNLPAINKAYTINKLADEPELTKTEYFLPFHLLHSSSNFLVNSPFVKWG